MKEKAEKNARTTPIFNMQAGRILTDTPYPINKKPYYNLYPLNLSKTHYLYIV